MKGSGLRLRRLHLVGAAWSSVGAFRRRVGLLAILGIAIAQAETVALILIALLVETAAQGSPSLQFEFSVFQTTLPAASAAAVAAGCVVAAAAATLLQGALSATAAARLEQGYRDAVVAALAQADWEYQSTQKVSRVQGRLRIADAPGQVLNALVAYFRASAAVLVFVVAAVVVNPAAAALMVAFGTLFSLLVYPLRRQATGLAARSASYKLAMTDDVVEALDQGADMRVFGAWPVLEGRYRRRSQELTHVRVRDGILASRFPVAYQYGAFLLLVAVLAIVASAQLSNSIGALAASGLLLLRSVQYGQAVQLALHGLAKWVPELDRLHAELEVPPPSFETGTRVLTGIDSVQLRGVSYMYPDSAAPQLHDVSVEIRPGMIVGVAGPSGAGKSTLGQILLRLRWPTSGCYTVNGIDAREYSDDHWRSVVSHVPQSPRLLHATLRENVTYFDQGVTDAQVLDALDAVGLGDLASELPDGLDTPLGPTGHSLSGGQVQRIGIARALARDSQFIVLDEPTSALDVDSEALVAAALEALARRPDALVVVIAHRPSTLLLCDHLIVMHDGRVQDSGPFTQVRHRNRFMGRVLAAAVL